MSSALSEAAEPTDTAADAACVAAITDLHVTFRRDNPTTQRQDFVIADGLRGPGRFLGCNVGVRVIDAADWYGEGEVKFYLDASLEERARRRQAELRARGVELQPEAARHDIAARDTQDSGRELAPLRKAPDAVEVDSTGLSVEQVVAIMADTVERRRRCG